MREPLKPSQKKLPGNYHKKIENSKIYRYLDMIKGYTLNNAQICIKIDILN